MKLQGIVVASENTMSPQVLKHPLKAHLKSQELQVSVGILSHKIFLLHRYDQYPHDNLKAGSKKTFFAIVRPVAYCTIH